MVSELLIEKAMDCRLVRHESVDNGHDCWGNYEYTTHYYVYVEDQKVRVFDDHYILSDGKVVLDTAYDFNIDDKIHKAKVKLGMRDQTKLEL